MLGPASSGGKHSFRKISSLSDRGLKLAVCQYFFMRVKKIGITHDPESLKFVSEFLQPCNLRQEKLSQKISPE